MLGFNTTYDLCPNFKVYSASKDNIPGASDKSLTENMPWTKSSLRLGAQIWCTHGRGSSDNIVDQMQIGMVPGWPCAKQVIDQPPLSSR